jgi:NADPH2:quinone reductase
MKAIIARNWCQPSDLEYAELPEPRPGRGEVSIEVRAIGCNFPDILIVQGKYQKKPPLPFAPGCELSGVVRAVGPEVSRFSVGQRVFALMTYGAYAEAVVAPADHVFALPDPMTFEEGAAFGLVYQTSWCALKHRAALKVGETLLVHGAAGGVGLSAVQIGKALGARVIATAGTPEKLGIARAAGADEVVNYRTEDWVSRVKALTSDRGADVIYDPVGGDTFDGSTKCIAFEGRLLVVGFAGGRIADIATNRVLLKNIGVVGVHWGLYSERAPAVVQRWMDELLALVLAAKLKPVIWKTFPLKDARSALAAIASRESYGKVVLVP